MRIIGGNLRGKKIKYLSSAITRPLRDFVKESIFNIIDHSNLIDIQIDKSSILDLYSGVGSFGIECISRGAKNVNFVEKDKLAFNTLYRNLKDLAVEKNSLVFKEDIKSFLKKNNKKKFDIFFLDPPFSSNSYLENLVIIKNLKLYNKNNLVIFHRETKIHENYNDIVNVIMTKKYGRSKIIFGSFS